MRFSLYTIYCAIFKYSVCFISITCPLPAFKVGLSSLGIHEQPSCDRESETVIDLAALAVTVLA